MRCPNCGKENPDSFAFCPICGSPVPKQASIDKGAVKGLQAAILRAVERRSSTDLYLSPYWIFFLIILLIVTSIVGFALMVSAILDLYQADPNAIPSASILYEHAWGGFVVIAVGSAIYYALLGYLIYMLVWRMNSHFSREEELRSGVLALVKSASSSESMKSLIAPELAQMEEADNRCIANDKKRNPIEWAVLIVGLPLVLDFAIITFMRDPNMAAAYTDSPGLSYLVAFINIALTLYLFYFLGKTVYAHDGMDATFNSAARMALSKLGFKHGPPYSGQRLPERSFWLYFLLSIVTIGIFSYYWWYTVLKDPNEHFRVQWQFEDNLVTSIQESVA